jgi:TRAP-type C4-dicarboxylate transport system permease small subunit
MADRWFKMFRNWENFANYLVLPLFITAVHLSLVFTALLFFLVQANIRKREREKKKPSDKRERERERERERKQNKTRRKHIFI